LDSTSRPAAHPSLPAPAGADPTRCPLCGGDNRCALEIERATGQPQPPCWCVDTAFPPGLLDTLPPDAQGVACVCAACVRAAAQRLP